MLRTPGRSGGPRCGGYAETQIGSACFRSRKTPPVAAQMRHSLRQAISRPRNLVQPKPPKYHFLFSTTTSFCSFVLGSFILGDPERSGSLDMASTRAAPSRRRPRTAP